MSDITPERALLNRNPGVRAQITSMPEFQAWKETLKPIEIDGETLFVIGGDQLKDIDQVVVMWINQFLPNLLNR